VRVLETQVTLVAVLAATEPMLESVPMMEASA